MDDVKSRDKSCRVSAVIDFCDQAHLVPAAEREWWDFNVPYESNMDIEAAENGILLRADLHRSFDAGTWIPMTVTGGRLVLYVVRTTNVSNQFAMLWHKSEMQSLKGVSKLCLFARVAWSVLALHRQFLGIRRLASENLLVRMKDGTVKEMKPEAFVPWAQSRSKPSSPTKRPRLRRLEEDDKGLIVAGELVWGEECQTQDLNVAEIDLKETGAQQPYEVAVDDDSALYHRGRKRCRSPRPTSSPSKRRQLDMSDGSLKIKRQIRRLMTVQ